VTKETALGPRAEYATQIDRSSTAGKTMNKRAALERGSDKRRPSPPRRNGPAKN